MNFAKIVVTHDYLHAKPDSFGDVCMEQEK